MANTYQEVLKLNGVRLEAVKDHPEANSYALLIVALLERGGPMTLPEVARRFEAAGVARTEDALASLKRCRPARPPVHRDGEHYSLDPFDDDADLWAFRLGLRPAKGAPAPVTTPAAPRLPGPEVQLTAAELDEAWQDAALTSVSARQLVLAVLDVHGAPMHPEDVVAAVQARTRWHRLGPDSAKFKVYSSPVVIDAEGRWAIGDADAALAAARTAVREQIATRRRAVRERRDPAVHEATMRAFEEERAKRGAALAKLRRVIVHGVPAKQAEALVLLDVGERTVVTFLHGEIDEAKRRLADYDIIVGLEIRTLLRGIGVDPTTLRLAELGPAQKSMKLNKRGRTLKITAEMLIQATCGISRPLEPDRLREYLVAGEEGKLRRRLESEAKALYAFHEYGRLHHCVRLRWGFLDERLPAPWVQRDEQHLRQVMQQALACGVPLEVVVGGAPGWTDPWSRAFSARVVQGEDSWDLYLVDEVGMAVREEDVQLARLAVHVH